MEQNNAVQKTVQNGADSFFLHLNQFRLLVSKFGAAHLSAWMIHNRATYPGLLFRAGTIAVGIVMAAVAMHMVSTGFGRIVEDVILQAATAIGLIALFVIGGIMFHGTVLSFRHVWKTWDETGPEQPKALPAGQTWQPPKINIDNLICLLPGESLAAFTVRAKAAEAETTHAIWAVYIPPLQKQAAIWTADKATDFIFNRGDEPFNFMLEETLRLPAGIDHANETLAQYQKYIEWFAPRYRRWIDEGAKIEADKGRAKQTLFEVMEAHAKAVSTLFLCLLFCLPTFGQSKTRQVDEALGTRIREIPEVGAKVIYAFQEGGKEKYYTRTGDGVKDYTALLQSTSGIVRFDDRGGQLIAVQKNGEIVARAENVERVNLSPVGPNGAPYLQESTTGDPIRPRGALTAPDVENTPTTEGPLNIHIPTPAETNAVLDNASREWDYRKTELWAAVRPVWKWIMSMFFSIIPLFICAGGLFRYYAGTAANEAFYGLSWVGMFIRRVHEAASGVTLVICWGIATVLLIDEFMLFIYMGIPLWAMLLTWFPSLWLAKLLTNWAVPNPPDMAGVRAQFNDPYAGQRRIG